MIKRYRRVTITVDVEIAQAAKPLTQSQEHYLLQACGNALNPLLVAEGKATPNSDVLGSTMLIDIIDLAEIG